MNHSRFRQWIACCLLLSSAVLPLHAWAVDTDGDGVVDNLDAFPSQREATIDTDGDGQPDFIDTAKLILVGNFSLAAPFSVGSSGSGGWTVVSTGVVRGTVSNAVINLNGKRLMLSINVPPAGAILSVNVNGSGATGYTHFDGQSGTTGMVYNYAPGQSYAEQRVLSPGSNGFSWYTTCSGNTCSATGHKLSGSIIEYSSLNVDNDDDNDGVADTSDKFPRNATETLDTDNDGIGNNADTDDDNDTVPDYIDADPLNTSIASEITLPVNSSYRGGSISEAQNQQ